MPQFIKLTRVTGWKVGEDKKRVATETKSVYIRPSEILMFSDEGEYTCVTLETSQYTVTEKAYEICRMIEGQSDEKPFYIPRLHENWQGNWWDREVDWWKNIPITSEWTNKDTLNVLDKTPYYTTTIVYTNGDIWE